MNTFLGGMVLALACCLTGVLIGCVWALYLMRPPTPPKAPERKPLDLPEAPAPAAPVRELRRVA